MIGEPECSEVVIPVQLHRLAKVYSAFHSVAGIFARHLTEAAIGRR